MKYRFSLLLALTMLVLSSCIKEEDNNTILDTSAEGAYPYVTDVVNGFFDLLDVDGSTSGFTVNTSATGAVSVSSIDVMKSFNGGTPVLHTTLSGTSGNVMTNVAETVSGLGISAADLALGDEFTFSFVLKTGDGRALTSPVTVGVPMSCVSDLAGTYSVHTTYIQHDFIAAEWQEHTKIVEVTKVNEGVYSVEDFSGGLYGEGPYVAAYGTSGFPVTFRDVCNNISWADQSDPWGPVVAIDGGVNSVDGATGVITISWVCEQYGESGISVYTPQ